MKLTVDQIKGLKVEAYINYVKDCCCKIEFASLVLPVKQQMLTDLLLALFRWTVYNREKEVNGKPSIWYPRYKKAAKNRIEELEKEIEAYCDNIRNVIVLADAKDFADELAAHRGNMTQAYINLAKTIDYKRIDVNLRSWDACFDAALEVDFEKFERLKQFNNNAADAILKDVEDEEFQYVDYILNGQLCKEYLYNSDVVTEFARLEFLRRIAVGDSSVVERVAKPERTLNKTQFTELVKALLELDVLRYDNEKMTVAALAAALNVDITKSEFDNKLQKMKERNADAETLFLDKLKKALSNWLTQS